MKITGQVLRLAMVTVVSTLLLGTIYLPATTMGPVRTQPPSDTTTTTVPALWGPIQALDFVSANEGWVLAYNQQGTLALLRTQNGGLRWTIIRPDWHPLGNSNTTLPMAIAFANRQDGWMVLEEGGGFHGTTLGLSQEYAEVAQTTDGGHQWHLRAQKLVFGDGPISVATTSSLSVWLSTGNVMTGQNGIWHTTDGGMHWIHTILRSPMPAYSSNVTALHASNSKRAVLLAGMQLPHRQALILDQWTTDGGRRWQTVRLPATGLPIGTMLPMSESSAAYRSPAHQWILAAHRVGTWNGPIHLFAYQPTRQRWHLVAIPRRISRLGYSPLISLPQDDVGYLADGTQIWRTSNNGESWVQLPAY